MAGGTLTLTGMLFGVARFDPAVVAAAVAALLSGIAVWGSNKSTAQEAATDMANAEADRSALIERPDLSDSHTAGRIGYRVTRPYEDLTADTQ